MSINNTEWVGPPETQEYIRALEAKITQLESAIIRMGGRL